MGAILQTYVHKDYPTLPYRNAALYLLGNGYPTNDADPYKQSLNQGGFISFGPVFGFNLMARASFAGLRTAWYHKWVLHRQLRPEVYGAEN